MNLLDTASLVVTPNGYKASKLYSIIPSDGTGDMTFARTGDTATRVNSSGLIESVLANKPRLDYFGSTCPKLLLEPQRTNLQIYSADIASALNNQSNTTVTANVINSPDGTQNADLLAFSGNGYRLRGLTVNAATTYTISAFYKNNTFTSGQLTYLSLSDGVIGAFTASINISAKTATFSTNAGAFTNVKGTVENYGNDWFRVSVTATSVNGGSGWFEIASTGITNSYYVWGLQAEAGAYATSYIPTTTASVTRNADSSVKTSATALIGQTEGTMFIDTYVNIINTGAGLLGIRNAGSTYIYIFNSGNSIISNVNSGGVAQASLVYNAPSSGFYKIAVAYKQNDFVMYINGIQRAIDTSGSVPTCNEVSLNDLSLGLIASSNVNSLALWKTRLTNQELVTLTSL